MSKHSWSSKGAFHRRKNDRIKAEDAVELKDADWRGKAGDCWCHKSCWYSNPKQGQKVFPKRAHPRTRGGSTHWVRAHFWVGPGSTKRGAGGCVISTRVQEVGEDRGQKKFYEAYLSDLHGYLDASSSMWANIDKFDIERVELHRRAAGNTPDLTIHHAGVSVDRDCTHVIVINTSRQRVVHHGDRTPLNTIEIWVTDWQEDEIDSFFPYGAERFEEEWGRLEESIVIEETKKAKHEQECRHDLQDFLGIDTSGMGRNEVAELHKRRSQEIEVVRSSRAQEWLKTQLEETAQNRRNEYREIAWDFLEKAKESISTDDLGSAKAYLSQARDNQFQDSTDDSSELEEELQATDEEIKRIEDAELAPRREIFVRVQELSEKYRIRQTFAKENAFEVKHSELLNRLNMNIPSKLRSWVENQETGWQEIRETVGTWRVGFPLTELDKHSDLDDLVGSAESEMASYEDEWQEEQVRLQIVWDEKKRKDNLRRDGQEEYRRLLDRISALSSGIIRAVSDASANYEPFEPSLNHVQIMIDQIKIAMEESCRRDESHFLSVEGKVKVLLEKLLKEEELLRVLDGLLNTHLEEREGIILETGRAHEELKSCEIPDDYWWGDYPDRKADLDDRVARLEGYEVADKLRESDRSYKEQVTEASGLVKGDPVNNLLNHRFATIFTQALKLCDPRDSGRVISSQLETRGFARIDPRNPVSNARYTHNSIFFHINDVIGNQTTVRDGCKVKYKSIIQTMGAHRGQMKAIHVEHHPNCDCDIRRAAKRLSFGNPFGRN